MAGLLQKGQRTSQIQHAAIDQRYRMYKLQYRSLQRGQNHAHGMRRLQAEMAGGTIRSQSGHHEGKVIEIVSYQPEQ